MLARILAIDWSGDASSAGQRQHIWIADWHDGSVTLTAERTREQTVQAVIAASDETPDIVVGFDFAFSYPQWFLDAQGCASADVLWGRVETHGERWLANCEPPFWGRSAKTCPPDHWDPDRRGFRVTEREVKARTGKWPSSSFKIGGAGAVGTGSVRGMPHLLTLKKHGFCIWPFDPPRFPLAIEIYPRIFAGKTRVSNVSERREHLGRPEFRVLPLPVLAAAEHSPDAFDALCALLGMVGCREQLETLPARPERAREGEIWTPREM